MTGLLTLALIVQPVLMPIGGFIIASTLTFVATATAWRGVRPVGTAIAKDAIVGTAFATVVYAIFTTGLGVALP